MASVNYQYSLEQPIFHQFHHPQAYYANDNKERMTLITKIDSLTERIKTLREKNDHLEDTVTDLRSLLSLLGEESLREEKEMIGLTSILESKRKIMMSKMKRINNGGSHLYHCSLFWN